jgi:hypothetical protein
MTYLAELCITVASLVSFSFIFREGRVTGIELAADVTLCMVLLVGCVISVAFKMQNKSFRKMEEKKVTEDEILSARIISDDRKS